jgi:hypothetical protein
MKSANLQIEKLKSELQKVQSENSFQTEKILSFELNIFNLTSTNESINVRFIQKTSENLKTKNQELIEELERTKIERNKIIFYNTELCKDLKEANVTTTQVQIKDLKTSFAIDKAELQAKMNDMSAKNSILENELSNNYCIELQNTKKDLYSSFEENKRILKILKEKEKEIQSMKSNFIANELKTKISNYELLIKHQILEINDLKHRLGVILSS